MRKTQIVSHRGRFGGSVVENTLAAPCGADVLQTDWPRELADYLDTI